MKLLALDSNSIFNRAFYGIKLLSTKDGLYTNAIFGFLNILNKLLKETEPDAVICAFDLPGPTFRHEMYDGYKAQRKGMPEELAQQLPYLKDLLRALGYTIVEQQGFEGDDILGCYACVCEKQGNQCVIASGDRDMFQLVRDGVSVLLASTKAGQPQSSLYDPAKVREEYGVEPPQLIDIKALMGDSSDNIPGVPGIGQKTASSLIAQFGSLDRLYEELEGSDVRPKVKEKLLENKESAYLSRQLGAIKCDLTVEEDLAKFRPRLADNAAAYKLLSRLEMFSMMDKFGITMPKGEDFEQLTFGTAAMPVSKAVKVTLEPGIDKIPGNLDRLDFLLVHDQHLISAAALSVPGGVFLWRESAEEAAKALLLSGKEIRTGSVKELYHLARNKGWDVPDISFDLEIAGYILNPTASDYATSRLAGEYSVSPPKSEGDFPEELAGLVTDILCFSALADKLDRQITQNDQRELFDSIEMPLCRVLASMETIGFTLDGEGLAAYGKELDIAIEAYQKEIYELAGYEFNINSPKQLGEVLFGKLNLPTKGKTKSGYSTNADVLQWLRGKHPIIEQILGYRLVAKLKSTYVDGLLKNLESDGRIHTVFQQTLTRTGRISSTEPNLQNIPIRSELGSQLRRFFVAPKGELLIGSDYSQIELRVMASMSGDKAMIRAFDEHRDIHAQTAAGIFGVDPGEVTVKQRSRAKTVNFGIMYGMGAYSLSEDMGVSTSEAKAYLENYYRNFPDVQRFLEKTIASGRDKGYVETLYRRRRYLPELNASNRRNQAMGERMAMNTPIQGTAADIIKIAMVRVYNRLRREEVKARLVLQIHDELIVECPEDEVERVSAMIREEMETAASLKVPLEADVHVGRDWFSAK